MAAKPSLRTALALAFLACCLGLFALPLGVAQSPGPVIAVQISGEPTDSVVRKSNGVLTYTFTVSFQCSSGTDRGDCSGQLGDTDVDVQITEPRKGDYPQGWAVAVEPLSFRITAKETQAVTVTVGLLEDEPEKSRFSIELQAQARPIVESPLGSGVGDLFNDNLAQSTTARDSVQASEELTTAEALVGLGRRYMWPLMGLAAVLMLAGVVLVERRRGSVEVSCDQPKQEILPGRGVSFPVRIRNSTREEQKFALRVSELPPGWSAILPLDEMDLAANDETQFYLSVKSPPTATAGQVVRGELRARAMRGTALEESTEFTVTVAQDPYSTAAFLPPPVVAPVATPSGSLDLPAPEPLTQDDVSFLEESAPAKPAKKTPKKSGKRPARSSKKR